MAKQEGVVEDHSAEVGRSNGANAPKNRTTDLVLWEYMRRLGEDYADRSILSIIREYDGRKRTNQLRLRITDLTERINGGEDEAEIR